MVESKKLRITSNDLPSAAPDAPAAVKRGNAQFASRPLALPTIQGVKPSALQIGLPGLASQPSTAAGSPSFPADWYANPTGPGQRYWDGGKWTESYSQLPAAPVSGPPVEGGSTTSGLVVVGYILAILMPLIGFILGIVVVTRPEKMTSKHGVWIIVASVVAFVVWLAIFSARVSSGAA